MHRHHINHTTCRLAFTLLALALGAAGGQAAEPAKAQTQHAKPTAKTQAKATPRQQLKNQAKGLALATETAEEISANQLNLAALVLTGVADCEFKQQVVVEPWLEHPGHFRVGFAKKRYVMVPHETATGAVRLEDKRNGVIWLQIPAKSMLMDANRGQRLVDGCTHSEQRAALAAVSAAGQAADNSSGLGITPSPEPTPQR